jgi:threonine synthase
LATYVCDQCLGPLEPEYDYEAIALTRAEIERRPKNLWRYRELLPIMGEPQTGFHSGFTPLVRCDRLAERLGIRELYIKDDSVNHPTLSYKDRVVSVAATRAKELGHEVLACASTGNLANSVSAHAARLGMECCVFIPDNLEAGKVQDSAIFKDTIIAFAAN